MTKVVVIVRDCHVEVEAAGAKSEVLMALALDAHEQMRKAGTGPSGFRADPAAARAG